MKLKKPYIGIGLLILFFSLTVIGVMNQSYAPQYNSEKPKSSAGEITIVTPENKTYTEPDTGYLPATHGFDDEPHLTYGTDLRFIDEYQGYSPGTYCWIRSDEQLLEGHRDFIKMGDAQGGMATWGVHNFEDPQSLGTVEFYLWSNHGGSGGSAIQRQYLQFRSSDDTIGFRITIQLHDEKIEYYNGASWIEIALIGYRKWTHHSVTFDCDAGVNGQFTWIVTNNQGIEAGRVENIEFENDLSTIDEMYLGTTVSDYGSGTYWDAFGFSWDPDYNIGDNLNEGLLLSYDTTENLDWKGYSLDGQANKTIMGNTTIPIPNDGLHTIQIFGNDSIGTNYESEKRHFSVDIPKKINIITPEDKVYTEPMSGYYPGKYGFENDLPGAEPIDWYVRQPDGFGFIAVDGLHAGHRNVLELRKTGGTDKASTSVTFPDNGTAGTIEYWLYKDTDSGIDPTRMSLPGLGGSLQFGIQSGDLYRGVWASRVTIASNAFTKDVWHHIRVDFDVAVGWQIQIDDTWYGSGYSLPFVDTPDYLYGFAFSSIFSGDHSDYGAYLDALDYSWNDGYSIGDNLDEGLLLSYDCNTTLDWQGYSLDGQNNVTILGNHTIPIPVNGTHSIQVFGNSSIGTIYQSEVRYFTYGTTAVPQITIISPTPNEFFNSVAPDFEIYTSGSSINTTWYTIDGGVTNITFSGPTGTINQTEWDKKGEEDIILRFYVNSTLGNSSYTEVTIKKDTTPPLITIDSPLENELFGKPAPEFNMTIVESNIDQMWYTLDYGVTNITHLLFNGTINYSEWSKIGNGTADIRFSVVDEAGNEAYADVTVRKEISDPIIMVNDPLEDEIFGVTAPFYNVTVIEPDFDSMWYTLDNGINNVTASGFDGDISQTEWNKQSSGAVTLKFYANDTLGNVGFTEITVEKDVTDPTIQINTPIEDAVFGDNAPSYDISITEPNLDSMWYTLDNGATNIPIFSFTGTIDQTEWNKKGSGTVAIRIHANDTMGNTDYIEVLVTKDLIDPIVTIISPIENDIFGANAPTYELSVSELNLDTMWYTLNNGVTNISLSSLTGIISQTEWNKESTGDVVIKFFARDEAGNEDYAEVIVGKDINIPLITIIAPEIGASYGLQPPQYYLSIIESNIDSMWYTLDFGGTIVPFTDVSGTIDQTEWNRFGDGAVIIRFYVRDEGNNEAFAEVSVTKDLSTLPPDYPDPDFLPIILASTLIGVFSLIGITLIVFRKKIFSRGGGRRGSPKKPKKAESKALGSSPMMFCQFCGAKLRKTNKFCIHCGVPLNKN